MKAWRRTPPHPASDADIAHDPLMALALDAMADDDAVEATTAERRDMTWQAVNRPKVGRYGAVSLVDFGAGNGTPLTADDLVRSRPVRAMGALLDNPWEDVTIERVDSRVKAIFDREVVCLFQEGRLASRIRSELVGRVIDVGTPPGSATRLPAAAERAPSIAPRLASPPVSTRARLRPTPR